MHHIARTVARHETDFAGDHGRDERGHGLSEHVAQGQEIEKTDGGEEADVAAIFGDAGVDGLEVGEDVAMGDGDTFGVAGSAGSEENLGDVGGRGGGEIVVRGGEAENRFHWPHGAGDAGRPGHIIAEEQRAGFDNTGDARHECGRGAEVDGNGDHALEQASPENHDPFRAVFAPEDNALAFRNTESAEAEGEPGGCASDGIVAEMARSPAPLVPQKPGAIATPDIVERGERRRIAEHQTILHNRGAWRGQSWRATGHRPLAYGRVSVRCDSARTCFADWVCRSGKRGGGVHVVDRQLHAGECEGQRMRAGRSGAGALGAGGVAARIERRAGL